MPASFKPSTTSGSAPNESPPWVALPSRDSVDSKLPTVISADASRLASGRMGPAESSVARILLPTRRASMMSPTTVRVVTFGRGRSTVTCRG